MPTTLDTEGVLDACSLMVLFRDLDSLCQTLTDGDVHTQGFSKHLQISITVAPILTEQQPTKDTPSLTDFFSETTQTTLLAPFRAQLRGYKSVIIQGYVNRDLAEAVREDMGRDRWSDFKQVLASFAAAKEEGSRLFQQRKTSEGCLIWQDAALDIEKMVQSSSWPALVHGGGKPFVTQLAELYFLVRLNVAHVKITAMQSPRGAYYEAMMAEDSLAMASRSLRQDYWMSGYKFRPSDQHLAKLRYRFALAIRLQAEPDTTDRALRHIEGALRLQPGDAAIMKERDNILAWKRRGY